MYEELYELGRDDLEEMAKVLAIFMDQLHPSTTSNQWVLDFRLKFDPLVIFKWIGIIDRIIDLPFPTVVYRNKAHEIGETIQEIFRKENIPLVIKYPLFIFIATFYQIFDTQALIYPHYRTSSEKLQAFLRLDPYLDNNIVVDHNHNLIGIVPGFIHPFDVLEYIVDSGIITISTMDIFQARPIELPTYVKNIDYLNIYVYDIETRNRPYKTEGITYHYL